MEAGCIAMGSRFKVSSLALSREWNGSLLYSLKVVPLTVFPGFLL